MRGELIRADTDTQLCQRAWVVFSGYTEITWLRWLKPGFRHCFVILNDGQCWMSLDPLMNHTEVSVHHHLPAEFDLPGWLESRGHKVIAAHVARDRARCAPLMLFTCVEAVKRILGLHNARVLTPWQLYRYLRRSAASPEIGRGVKTPDPQT